MNNHLIKNSILFICLSGLSISDTPAETPTDDQLLELEQQIEQQEKAKQRAAEDARRSAEAQKLKEERARLEEERRKLEEERNKIETARQDEIIQIQKEEEAMIKAENEQREKFNDFITSGHTALETKDKTNALSNFQQAVLLYPNNMEALTGLKKAEELLDPFCYKFTGTWEQPGWGGETVKFYENGKVSFKSTVVYHENEWFCHPDKKEISMDILNNVSNAPLYSFKLSNDNTKIYFVKRNQLYLQKISDDN